MKIVKRYRNGAAIVLLVIGAALAIAACSSSSNPSVSRHNAAFVDFSRCMRTHGVPNFPDPSPGGGIAQLPRSGINPFSPSFRSAKANCLKLLPGGGPPDGGPWSPQVRAQMLKVSKCMRQHDIPDFPDPTISPPSNPARAIARSLLILDIPATIRTQSPAFKHAATMCKFPPDDWYPLHGSGPLPAGEYR
ncbi:MAG: hypothetical protein ACTHQQ_04335 [Solirubrobacteraceae bacterium]